MNNRTNRIIIIFSAASFFLACHSNTATKTDRDSTSKDSALASAVHKATNLVLQKTIFLPNVKGGFDLMALDIKGNRLFVSAEDNHTLEVIDLRDNMLVSSVPDFNEPKWVAYQPEKRRVYVATGADGKVTELDDSTFKKLHAFTFKEKCNNLRFDATKEHLFVGIGNSFGAIGIINVKKDKIETQIPLSDYPKQFEIDSNQIYVNIPRKNSIDVIDRVKQKVITTWPVKEGKENVPMALDRIHRRLFIACEPGKFIVYSPSTGSSITSLDISKGADGIYYDAKRSLIYISCGEGNIEIIQQQDADHYRPLEKIPTVKGAGTSLFSPELDQLFLAVPQSEDRKAAIQIYRPAH